MSKKLVIDVPEDLKNRFKTTCVNEGTTMRAEIIESMRSFIEAVEEEKKFRERNKKEEASSPKKDVDKSNDNNLPPWLKQEVNWEKIREIIREIIREEIRKVKRDDQGGTQESSSGFLW